MRTTTRADYLDRIRRVLRFIQERLDNELTPDECARVAHFSRYHFHRIFSGLVGESLGEHVRRIRLERAAGELRRTDRSVIEIALAAGYGAHEPFTRAFRAHFGVPPAEFRRRPEPLIFRRALCGVHYGIDDVVSRFVPLQEDSKMIEMRIESQPARRLLAIPHKGDYMRIGKTFDRLFAFAGERGLLGPETESIGIYYDDWDVTPLDELRAHAGVTVAERFGPAPDGFELIDVRGGEYAVGIHRGPYDKLHESYRWLFGQWLPASEREAANQPCHEIYMNDPSTTKPEDLVTHICIPLVGDDKTD
ncbi:MAG: AraC family transcriptional regulator [Vicinamibacteraceae bacterium]